MKKGAVFLDRDGVLVKEKGYIASTGEMEIFSYVPECIRQIHQKGYYAIVITNQSGVARGLFPETALLEMNDFLMRHTGVDAVYYCPHHPMDQCDCRKPGTGMLEAACKEFQIDRERSYMAGDRADDITAGRKARVRTALLESGYGTARLEYDVKPDYIFEDLRGVIKIL